MEEKIIQLVTQEVLAAIKGEKPCCGACDGKRGDVRAQEPDGIRIGVSVRHLHLCAADFATLFGADQNLERDRDLYQEGEFASKQVVALVGPKLRSLAPVRVLGPLRKATQVEISRTDAIGLGLNPPVRPSGNLEGASLITIVGPRGSVSKPVAIRANRHIHMSPADAAAFNVTDGQLVSVELKGDRPLIFHEVQVRVSPKFRLEMHLDTDDANAVGVICGMQARIVGGAS
jgi:putative phosphotransacetylase